MPGRLWAACLAILFLPAVAGAQVNAERFRNGSGDDGTSGSVELAFTNRTGNTDLAEGGVSVALGWRRAPHTVLLVADASAGKADDETTVNRGFVHLRGGRMLGPRLTWEGFVQHEYDREARLDARSLVGTGPRFTLHDGETAGLFWGIAYMFEREAVDVAAGSGEASVQHNHRISTYLSLTLDAGERVSFVDTAYVQPRVDESRDIRLLEEATLKVKLVGALSLKIAFSVRYDGDPPVGVKYLDTAVTNRLAWDF
jgi:putative salt-induced outer membrane protein YdiY